ncbi:hypothetical protein [Streptosporangium sp. NPDC048865]|uniref:hypothetical protein n=1 Tax=Streptosporangium sp. NPDC048865 TaxID=3155766 RepID=UPI00341F2A08
MTNRGIEQRLRAGLSGPGDIGGPTARRIAEDLDDLGGARRSVDVSGPHDIAVRAESTFTRPRNGKRESRRAA